MLHAAGTSNSASFHGVASLTLASNWRNLLYDPETSQRVVPGFDSDNHDLLRRETMEPFGAFGVELSIPSTICALLCQDSGLKPDARPSKQAPRSCCFVASRETRRLEWLPIDSAACFRAAPTAWRSMRNDRRNEVAKSQIDPPTELFILISWAHLFGLNHAAVSILLRDLEGVATKKEKASSQTRQKRQIKKGKESRPSGRPSGVSGYLCRSRLGQ